MEKVLTLFHHIHHKENGEHEVHHCGYGLGYKIHHCTCKKHNIDKQSAIGHDFNKNEVYVEFIELCPEGGWHIESGKIKLNEV